MTTSLRVHLPSATSLVARSENTHVIGVDNRLPWHLGSDLRRFRSRTLGHVVVMGRRTMESIGKPLPKRLNVVLSRSEIKIPGVIWAKNIEDALYYAEVHSILLQKKEFFVIGGQIIYNLFQPFINKVFLTEVDDGGIAGDAKFDVQFDPREWQLFKETAYSASPIDDFDFTIKCYLRYKQVQRMGFIDKYLRTNPELAGLIDQYVDRENINFSRVAPTQLPFAYV